jgi:arylsulfatase A-like enzyme
MVGLPPDHPTLPSLLKKAGYSTTLVGKWHLGVLPKFGPLQSGYDHFFGFRGGAVDYYRHAIQRDDLWDDDVQVHQMGYLTDLLGSRAVDVVNKYGKSGRPFLISLHFNAPHWPWEAPGDEAESNRLRSANNLFDFDGGTQKTYQRMIQEMDLQIGRVLEALHKNGLAENTIVIFTSDNGGERFADTWPFTGRKTELLEGGLRIPAINLLPMLTQNSAAIERKLFWRYKGNAQRAARDGDYKYLKILDNTFLFNVVEDPMERANLKVRRKDVYDRIVAGWHEWNAAMLREVDDSSTGNFSGDELADHIGAQNTNGKADNPVPSQMLPAKPH